MQVENTCANDVESCSGMLGSRFWNRFNISYKDRIVSKKGEKFELDRSNWKNDANFKLTHENIGAEMVEASIAVEFDEHVWMDSDGYIFDKKDSMGFIVTHSMNHFDYFIVADELGGNVSQKGDVRVGGTRLLCKKGLAPKKLDQIKTNTSTY